MGRYQPKAQDPHPTADFRRKRQQSQSFSPLQNKYTYTQLGAGAYYLDTNKDFSFSGFYRAGLYISLTSRLTLNGDVGYYHIETLDNKHAGIPARMYAIEPRISLEYQVLKRLGIFAAGGYNWTRTYQGNKFENKGVFEAGLVLF